VIKRLQRKGRAQGFDAGFDRRVRQQAAKHLPEQRSTNRVARQNLRQENGKGPSAPAALATIAAEDPLAAKATTSHDGRIIAVEKTVPV